MSNKNILSSLPNHFFVKSDASTDIIISFSKDSASNIFTTTNYVIAFTGNPTITNQADRINANIFDFLLNNYQLHGFSYTLSLLEGSFVLCIHDKTKKLLFLANDRLGMWPLFYTSINSQFIASNNPDVIASSLPHSPSLNTTSLAEFIRTGCVSPGFSYYMDILSADFASAFCYDLDSQKLETSQYFSPSSQINSANVNSSYYTLRAAVSDLRDAFRTQICKYSEPIAEKKEKLYILMSAGLDSRSILGDLDPSNSIGITLTTFNNREYKYTQSLASLQKIQLISIHRDYSFYYDNIYSSVALSYGMSSFNQDHYGGHVLDKLKSKVLVSGCYFDYFLKGLASNKRNLSFNKRSLPWDIPAKFGLEYYHKDVPVNKTYQDSVDQRRSSRLKLKNTFSLPFYRVCPLALEHDSSMRNTLLLFTKWELFISSRQFIEFILHLPLLFQLNRRLLRNYISRYHSKSAKIRDSNTDTIVYRFYILEFLARIANSVNRKIKSATLLLLATITRSSSTKLNPVTSDLSWFDSYHYVRHPSAAKIFYRVPLDIQEIISDLLEFNPWIYPSYENFCDKHSPDCCLRVITLSVWLMLRNDNQLYRI